MPTIGDYFKKIYQNYIAPTAEDIKVGKKEEKMVHPPEEGPEYKETWLKKKLSMPICRATAEQCPLFMKGGRKKAMDSIRAWHNIETEDQKTVPVKVDLRLIKAFEKRTQLKIKWLEARVASFVYGDGYLLITYENDEKTKIHDPPARTEINGKLVINAPWKVRVLNSEFIADIDYYPAQKEKYQKLFTRHFHYVDTQHGHDYWIHPDRVIHIPNDKLPHREFGNSTINLLRNIIKSMINIDISCGEILSWFAHGSYDVKENGLDEDRLLFWKKVAKEHPGLWAHDETAEIKSINPTAIDPKPFYDYLVLKVASAFRMPTHVLTGVQLGKVTGAEVGMGDYVKDVKDDQDLLYTPLLENLYTKLLEAKGRVWKYIIVWNAIYIDELAEAEIMFKRTESATLAMNGQRGAGGFVNQKEAREIFNKGQIVLDTENIPTDIPKPIQPMAPKASDDDDEEKPKKKKEQNLYDYQLDASQKAMIKKRKLQAGKEKKLGDEVIEEQDGLDKDQS